jgi:hypothetical protein
MLGVPLPTIRHELDQCDAASIARSVHRALGRVVHRQHVVAVCLVARDAVAYRLVDKLACGGLLVDRRGIGVAVVFDDDDERATLNRREIDPLVERAGGRSAVSDVNEANPILAAHLERQRHARHNRHHVAKRRDLTDEAAIEVAEVDVELATTGRRIRLRHVLSEHLDRRRTLDEHRPKIANERRHNVAALERVCASDRVGFLTEGAKKPTNDLCLPVERNKPLFERARQSHPVVEVEQLRAGEVGRG